MDKKGDASIVATVLLIVSAIAIALMVTTFSKQTEEQVSEKIITMGSSVECADVRISVESYVEDGKNLTMKNRGTLGINKAVLRVYGETIGNEDVDFSKKNCPAGSAKFLPQETCPHNIFAGVDNVYKIEVIPIIISEDGELGCEERITTWEK
ncbi:hypothetical protein HYV89_00085 [Candidatus Woesearchaeota archaeon]|nr:hypothetical protein [Candidatus Woesearchaeota archaeon]